MPFSLQYLAARTPLLRRALGLVAGQKIDSYRKEEHRRYHAHPGMLSNYERRVFSQNGEDGILAEIFDRIGATNRFFVEFGCGDGTENNTRNLVESAKWSGLWMDCDAANAARAGELAGDRVAVRPVSVTRENIRQLLEEHRVPPELDLLSLDIDGNDFWIWQELSMQFRPRVAVLEYNAAFPPGRPWVMPYNPAHRPDGTRWFGASLDVWTSCMEPGYKLVACDSVGVNSFWIRHDLVGDLFVKSGDLAFHYTSPKHKLYFFGHPSGRGPWLLDGPGWATDPFKREMALRTAQQRNDGG